MAMNFNSTGNNFGAGQIAFKSHQEENFVVLNAKFTYNPESPEYQAADVLEIYVPDLKQPLCLLRDGWPYGFDFEISDAELDLYNSAGTITERIQSAYQRL